MVHRARIALMLAAIAAATATFAQTPPPAPAARPAPDPSPLGHSAIEVGGHYVPPADPRYQPRYEGGKRGRDDLFGSGADYGKKLLWRAPVWRAGANVSTRMKTETALEIGGKRVEPGEYTLFVDLKEGGWTLIVSRQPWQKSHEANEKIATWGAYNYDPKYDVVRAPMKVEKMSHSLEEFTINFVDVTSQGGKLTMWWDKEFAAADFKIVS